MKRTMRNLFCGLLLFCGAPLAAAAQEAGADEVLKVNTRVVFLDALVKDKKTKQAVGELKPESFEVLADGRPRVVSYFAREGDKNRRPLALVLVFDLERIGAGRYLRRTEILEAMAAELAKLPPEDEVAVMVLDPGGLEGRREWLVKFTRNRAQVAAAMSIIPTLVGQGGGADEEDNGISISTSTAKNAEEAKTQLEDFVKPGEQVEIEEIVEKKGNKAKRIAKPDGTIIIQRTNKDGSIETDVREGFDLGAAALEVSRVLARERPNSQGAVVYVTDGIAPIFYVQRDYVESKLLKSNLIFSALVTDMKTGFKLAMPLLKPLGNLAGLSIAGGAQHLAKQTGGESVRVRRPADYAAGLAKIIGNLTARYSLGFTLAEAETDDGRMHPLEVRVKAKDAKGKERKLEVTARKGYYMPAAGKAQTATQTADKPAPPGNQ